MQPGAPIQLAVSNTETIAGATIVQSLGLVTGSTVRAKTSGKTSWRVSRILLVEN